MTNPHSASPDTPDVASQPEGVAKPFMRTIKSFVKRAGRMGSGQERAMAELGPQFLVPYQPSAINFEAVFAGAAGGDAGVGHDALEADAGLVLPGWACLVSCHGEEGV